MLLIKLLNTLWKLALLQVFKDDIVEFHFVIILTLNHSGTIGHESKQTRDLRTLI